MDTTPNKIPISAAILSKNSQAYIEEVLESLADLDEVIVLDTGSEDQTIEIAKTFKNTKVHQTSFSSFGILRNKAASVCRNDWVLCIDSDEVLSSDALKQIKETNLDETKFYSFPFKNYFNNKWIRSCGWYPDRHIRLYNKQHARFSEEKVHEKLISPVCQEHKFNSHIIHYSYSSIHDFLRKMQLYSDFFASQYQGRKEATVFTAISHAFFAFIKSYFLKKGFIEGYEGFLIASYQSITAFYKYLKLREANLKLKDSMKKQARNGS